MTHNHNLMTYPDTSGSSDTSETLGFFFFPLTFFFFFTFFFATSSGASSSVKRKKISYFKLLFHFPSVQIKIMHSIHYPV